MDQVQKFETKGYLDGWIKFKKFETKGYLDGWIKFENLDPLVINFSVKVTPIGYQLT
jgi:hypothetical protein